MLRKKQSALKIGRGGIKYKASGDQLATFEPHRDHTGALMACLCGMPSGWTSLCFSKANGNMKHPPCITEVWPCLASLRNFDLLGKTLELNTEGESGRSLSLVVLLKCSPLHWEPVAERAKAHGCNKEEQRFHVLTLSLRSETHAVPRRGWGMIRKHIPKTQRFPNVILLIQRTIF